MKKGNNISGNRVLISMNKRAAGIRLGQGVVHCQGHHMTAPSAKMEVCTGGTGFGCVPVPSTEGRKRLVAGPPRRELGEVPGLWLGKRARMDTPVRSHSHEHLASQASGNGEKIQSSHIRPVSKHKGHERAVEPNPDA